MSTINAVCQGQKFEVLCPLNWCTGEAQWRIWLDQEEQMKNSFHVGGRRSLKRIGKDEPM
jgi:hypothetical protein